MHAILVEQNPNPVLQLDAEGRVVYANPAAQAALGRAAGPDWAAAVRQAGAGGKDHPGGGTGSPAPVRITHQDPDCIYEFTLLPDPENGGMLAFGQDVTAQRRLEAERRLAEERFRLAGRAVSGMLYDLNLHTNEVYRPDGLPQDGLPQDGVAQEDLAQMMGMQGDPAANTAEWWLERIHPDDIGGVLEMVDRLKRGDADALSIEYRVRHADGHWIDVWDQGTILRDEDGGVLRLVGMASDITQRKHHEKKAAFISTLAARLAEMTDAGQATAYTARSVGEYLGADRCIVTEVAGEERWVSADYAPNLAPLEGALPSAWMPPELLSRYTNDRQAVVDDLKADLQAFPGLHAALPDWLGAFVITPGIRSGQRLGSLTVVSVEPRRWQPDELDLLEQANHLLWLTIEKARLQAQNRWGEQVFVKLLAEIPTGIAYLAGPEHRFALANPAYRRIASGRGELLGRTIAEVWPENAGEFLPILDDVYTTGEPFYRENLTTRIIRHGKEQDVNFLMACTLSTDVDGEVIGLLLMVQEKTEEVRAKQEIQEERARLKALIEHAPVGVVLTDENGQLVLANPAAESLYARPVPTGRPYSTHAELQLCYPDGSPYPPRDLPMTRAALDGETTLNLDMLIVWPNGQRRPLLLSTAPVRSSSGRLIGAVGMFQDISERVELRDRTAYQAQVLETVHDAIISIDINWVITSWNKAAESLYGWTAAEMIGRSDWEGLMIPNEAMTNHRKGLGKRKRLKQDEVLTMERVHVNRRGERLYVEMTVSAMYSESGELRGYVTAIRDMTERHKAELALRQYAARLERSNRDLEDFAFIASHDLQEPLRKVHAFGDLLLSSYRGQLDERGADYVDRMVNAAVRMQKMLESLLAYSRVSTRGQPFETVDLNQAAASALEDLESRLKTTGGRVDIGPLPTIQGDPQQLEQIFLNLIGNGLKFHARGVAPIVRVESRPLDGERVEVTVTDNGVGFAMEFADRLFQPFQRLHGRSAFEGSGVGLAICRKITERHGGSINGQSIPGQGTRFTIILPVRQPAALEMQPGPDSADARAGDPA